MNLGKVNALVRSNHLNQIVEIGIRMLTEKYPVPILHLFQIDFSVCCQFVLHRHSDIKRIIRNRIQVEFRRVRHTSYHGKIERSCDDLLCKLV